MDTASSAASNISAILKLTGNGATETAKNLDSAGSIGGAIVEGKELYDFADMATSEKNTLYWAYREAKSNGYDNPTSQDIKDVMDVSISNVANKQYINNMGMGIYKFFGGFAKILFPMNWSSPETDKQFQEWYKNSYGVENPSEVDPTYGSGYYSGGGFGGGSGGSWGLPPSRGK